MAPHGEAISSSHHANFVKPPRLLTHDLQRTISDISFELSKEAMVEMKLPPISEVEEAKCECCGMSEECTAEYIDRVRNRHLGKWVCGLCAEAVKEEMEKNEGKMEDALRAHMSACARFNNVGRAYPVLLQAEAMREMLKKSTMRPKSVSPKGNNTRAQKKGGITRSSSCIAAITKNMTDLALANSVPKISK